MSNPKIETHGVTSEKKIDFFSEPQFSHLFNGNNHVSSLPVSQDWECYMRP